MPDDPRARLSPPPDAVDDVDAVALQVRARLAAGRRALGLEADMLDVVCGLRQGTITRLEAGRSRVTPLHLFRLAAVFDVGVDWFFAETASLPPRPRLPEAAAAPSSEEMRRFLAVFARLVDRNVRAEIRALVHALADRACRGAGDGLPVAPGDFPPEP